MGKQKKKFKYRLWEPKAIPVEDFPFSYTINPIDDPDQVADFLATNTIDLTIDYSYGDDIKKIIKTSIMDVFPFHRYLDINSPEYIGKENKLQFNVKINVFQLVKVLNKKGVEKETSKHMLTWIVVLNRFTSHFQYNLVKTLDQLRKVVHGAKIISFDLETGGLNPLFDKIVGVPLSVAKNIGYYVPVKHDEQFKEFNLGKAALDIIYEALIKADIVLMFNAEFDMRFMEFNGYDMSKVKYFDTQLSAWFMDPDNKQTSLKWFEKYFMGYYRKDLKDTMNSAGLSTFNTAAISPENILFYGAQDGISTFELYFITKKYHDEFSLSAQIDQMLIYPFSRMKNHGIRINTKYIKSQLDFIIPRLNELEEIISEYIGDINLNSSTQKIALFESFNLDTGVLTDSGKMSTSNKAIDGMIESMEESGKDIPLWLQYFGERSRLEKLRSTFFGSLFEQANLNGGRVRINYRNTSAATGRLSSGGYIDE